MCHYAESCIIILMLCAVMLSVTFFTIVEYHSLCECNYSVCHAESRIGIVVLCAVMLSATFFTVLLSIIT